MNSNDNFCIAGLGGAGGGFTKSRNVRSHSAQPHANFCISVGVAEDFHRIVDEIPQRVQNRQMACAAVHLSPRDVPSQWYFV